MRFFSYIRNMSLRLRLGTTCVRAGRSVIRVLAWIPVLFVAIVLVWGYYVYVYVMNISVFFIACAHVIFALQLTSYLRTIFTTHKPIPEQFKLTEAQLDRLDDMDDDQTLLKQLAQDLPVKQCSRSGNVRYCDGCDLLKPDRTHHCSMCNRCVLKMDHHCPWVNNCVGWSNYKFFVLFLFYTVVLCVWVATTGAWDFIKAWHGTVKDHSSDKFNVIFCMIVCSLFGLSSLSLLVFHTYLSLFNKTTLENMQPPRVAQGVDRRLYFLGFKENLREVFGSNFLLAMLPVATSLGDGVTYKTRSISGHVEMGVVTTGGQSSAESDADATETQPLTSQVQV
ncbi:palmitoyltransferase ZDHHC20-like isoform X2 [Halichondria panicea]|uniref:palmitoyltransferase ZDHHC20-like isoform X2 n=1 Tax=Halichondria panicea TaxID=6063 RepID=UPI00312B3E91